MIILARCDDEIAELEVVVHRLRILDAANLDPRCGDMAVLYRANSQSLQWRSRWCAGVFTMSWWEGFGSTTYRSFAAI